MTQLRQPERLPERVRAFHECGHAMAAWLHGCRVQSVSIEPRRDSLGRINTDRDLMAELRASTNDEIRFDLAIAELTIAWAGEHAQKKIVRDEQLGDAFLDLGCEGDRRVRDALRAELGALLDDDERDKTFCTTPQRRLGEMVERHWDEICQLANALEHAVTIDEDGITSALEDVRAIWALPVASAAETEGK